MELKSQIFEGQVIHKRYHQKKHKFQYNVFSFLINIDDLEDLNKNLYFFSFNKFNLFSFNERDHGKKNGSPIKDWISGIISKSNVYIKENNLKVFCLCYPRILGYVFNPITVWSVYDKNDLKILIYEVRNTFGEDHSYIFVLENEDEKFNHNRRKKFHVSPFIDLNADYNFSTEINNDFVSLVIKESYEQKPLLLASFNGNSTKLNNINLIKIFFKYPLMTLKVTFGIHVQALFLFLKKVRFVPHPKNKINDISFGD